MSRTAIVLFNLGGPDEPAAVRPFLQNLFSDPAIIALPGPLRWLVARLIARRRAPVALEIYRKIGGRSPLLPLTRAQAGALQQELGDLGTVKVFVAMRYWHPFAAETVGEVSGFAPDEIILLPLYPQYSTTTTGSSVKDWQRAAARAGLQIRTTIVCCYPDEAGLVAAQAAAVAAGLAEAARSGRPRVLFSAHGLPEKIVAGGDPYQAQVEQTAAAVVARLADPALDWVVCYQSRVGPLKWIGPSTEDELRRAGRDRVPVVVVPIAFVSEHSETLVELDIEYRHQAAAWGVPAYFRVPALGTAPDFILGLAGLVREAHGQGGIVPAGGRRHCPAACGRCALN